MSPDDSRPDHQLTQLADWLPTPAERDLRAGRHQVLKEHLMTEIRTHQVTAPNRRRRLAVVVPVLAATAAAVATVVTVAVDTRAGQGPPDGPAVQLLARVAAVTSQQPTPAVRDDQYQYVETVVSFVGTSDPIGRDGVVMHARAALEPPHTRQVWLPVADLCQRGLLRERGQDTELVEHAQNGDLVEQGHRRAGVACPNRGYLNNPTYRLLASLPTDPNALLAKIYSQTKGHGPNPDAEAFTTIGDLLRESVAPPQMSAALYRAAALIPGVRMVPDAVAATGRHGVAVTRDADGRRTEWIFDRTSLLMIGERDVLTADGPMGKTGDVVGSTAILAMGIVDTIGAT